MIKSWTARLAKDGYEASYIYGLHARLSQTLGDAVHDNVLARNPCSRRTAALMGGQRPYVAATTHVWALRDAMEEWYCAGVLLGTFAGLRVAEACGLRVADVAFLHREIRPAVQYPAEPLKTAIPNTDESTRTAVETVLAARAEEL